MPFPRLVLLLDIDTQSAFEVMHTALDHLSHDIASTEEGGKSFEHGGGAGGGGGGGGETQSAMAMMAMAGMAVDDDGDDASFRGLALATAASLPSKVRGRRREGRRKGEHII
jgi:hypothetical protein